MSRRARDGRNGNHGRGELRVKESGSHRGGGGEPACRGRDAEELEDGMRIRRIGSAVAGRVATHGDHRWRWRSAILGARDGKCDRDR
jgi:5-enolpyruvylshikimate-3-phosphate synthase